jgi:Spy/CpxP family protein refolding chaperone
VRYCNAAVFFLAGAILVGGTISGDDTKPTKTKGQLPPGFKKLNLTEEQKKQIFGIQSTYKKKIAALKKQIEELQDKQKSEIFNVLTKEQKAKLLGADTGDTKDKKGKGTTTKDK